ncbi:dTDP-4-amino-4,6-dideoxygalactose transaminase [Gammaproteobacteria bacterium]|nr:dTDP-4-amino-4,6-dideoxygalactose transaminase [Gammaproteobacteria bacterium]
MKDYKIPFNKPFTIGNELEYIKQAVESGKISGDGTFTKKCHDFFATDFGLKRSLLTTSCTDALEMSAILLNIEPGDEVILPAYTFVSTANAFALRGAKLVFVDSYPHSPNIDASLIEDSITSKTKAIVIVHYAGIACDMDLIMSISKKYNISVVEDAAQAIDSYHKGRLLGTFGVFGTYSFHETKNLGCGEGGLLIVNDEAYFQRAEIIREKGTNRSSFFRGETDKYGWVDIGSSFLPSDINAAYLFAQLEKMEEIQSQRIEIFNTYYRFFESRMDLAPYDIPHIPAYSNSNGHMFYLVLSSEGERDRLISEMKKLGIFLAFHYQSLNKSVYFKDQSKGNLRNCDKFSDCLVRLPLYFDLSISEVNMICESIIKILCDGEE